MCWKNDGTYHTAKRGRKCSRCGRAIQPRELYLEAVHIPGGCGGYDADRDIDVDCGTDGFKVEVECSRCLGLQTREEPNA